MRDFELCLTAFCIFYTTFADAGNLPEQSESLKITVQLNLFTMFLKATG